MDIGLEILILFLLILLNGLFALSEIALVSIRRGRLAVLEREGHSGAAEARALSEDPQRFLPTIQVGITLVSVLTGVFGGARIASHIQTWLESIPSIAKFAPSLALAIVVVGTTYLTLVIGELVPKQLALRNPEQTASRVARPIAAFSRFGAPAIWLLGRSTDLILRLFGRHGPPAHTVTEEELKMLITEGAATGVIEHQERDIINRVLRLADKPVRAIMTPRNDLAWIDRTDPKADIVATLRAAPHSRFVVCDGSVDNVVGVVEAKDLLDRMLGGEDLAIAAVLKQPMVMPDTVTALEALEQLRSDALGIALVMDEYGSFEGVVTASDVLAAIVGDPTDTEAQVSSTGPDGEATVTMDGMMPIDELKARLELPALPAEGSYHTVGGLLLALLRRVPAVGDRIVFAGWRFEVLGMDGRRVDRVRASRDPGETRESST